MKPTVSELFRKRKAGRRYRNVLTVDPGLGGTGLAFWRNLQQEASEAVRPCGSAVLRSTKKDWLEKSDDLADDFGAFCGGVDGTACDFGRADLIIIETPALWPGSAKSYAATASGNLIKLAILVGRYVEAAVCQLTDYHIVLASPSDWKGQLKPQTVKKRIREVLGKTYREHEHAAVGIGLAVQGWL